VFSEQQVVFLEVPLHEIVSSLLLRLLHLRFRCLTR